MTESKRFRWERGLNRFKDTETGDDYYPYEPCELVDLLNELHEKEEILEVQLRSTKNEIDKLVSKINSLTDTCHDCCKEIKKENKELKEENESRKEYQRILESKIKRLKDRVKIFEKHYSAKDRQRIKNGELKGCLR